MSQSERIRRNASCPCGSGRRYKHCCGRAGAAPQEAGSVPPFLGLPERVLVVPGYLDASECARLIRMSRELERVEAETKRRAGADDALVTGVSDDRVTTAIKTFARPEAFLPVVARALRETVEPAFAVTIEWFEWPDVLFYRPGGRYDRHTDADIRDRSTGRWQRALDRDLSLLVYLDDDFTGGGLEFPDRGETVRPETGMLVAFPSDHRFAHAALPVTSGSRHVIVSWAAVAGSPRVHAGPRLGVVYPDRRSIPDSLPVRQVAGAGVFIEPEGRLPA